MRGKIRRKERDGQDRVGLGVAMLVLTTASKWWPSLLGSRKLGERRKSSRRPVIPGAGTSL